MPMENNKSDDCGGCKDSVNTPSVKVYLEQTVSAGDETLVNVLCDTFGYKESQALAAVEFSKSRGECLIYAGGFDSGIVFAQVLADNGINHRVESIK